MCCTRSRMPSRVLWVYRNRSATTLPPLSVGKTRRRILRRSLATCSPGRPVTIMFCLLFLFVRSVMSSRSCSSVNPSLRRFGVCSSTVIRSRTASPPNRVSSMHTYISGVVICMFDSRAQMFRCCLCSSCASVLTHQAPLISSYEARVPATGLGELVDLIASMMVGLSSEVCLLCC